MLARKIYENNESTNERTTNEQSNQSEQEDTDNNVQQQLSDNQQMKNSDTIDLQMKRTIPYKISEEILTNYYKVDYSNGFEPDECECSVCGSDLGPATFPRGVKNSCPNGYLVTNIHTFIKVTIKVKKCTNKKCDTIHVAYPFRHGKLIFNQ